MDEVSYQLTPSQRIFNSVGPTETRSSDNSHSKSRVPRAEPTPHPTAQQSAPSKTQDSMGAARSFRAILDPTPFDQEASVLDPSQTIRRHRVAGLPDLLALIFSNLKQADLARAARVCPLSFGQSWKISPLIPPIHQPVWRERPLEY